MKENWKNDPKKIETKPTHPINFPGSELFQKNETKEAHHTNQDTALHIYIYNDCCHTAAGHGRAAAFDGKLKVATAELWLTTEKENLSLSEDNAGAAVNWIW